MYFGSPEDFSTTVDVDIDPDDILDYVREHRDWFADKLNLTQEKSLLKDFYNMLNDIIDSHDNIRRWRDKCSNNRSGEWYTVRMYEDFIKLRDYCAKHMEQ